MGRKNSPDILLLGLSCALVVFGILILGSVSSSFSLERTGSAFYYLKHQLLYGLLPGIFLGSIAYLFPLQRFKKFSFVFLVLATSLSLMVFLPIIGGEVKGAYRWVDLGPFSFQPSEFLKIAFIVYGAAWLSARKERGGKNNLLLPFIIILGIIALLLVLQRDVSTLGVIGAVGIMMYFFADTPLWHIFIILGTGLSALALMIRLAPYRFSRIAVFLNSNLDPLGIGYQLKQALIGIGSGGITGVGLGLSFQKFGVLPEPISDSIFAVFAEEMGFIGAFVLLLLFLAFAWRGITIAKKIQDPFAKLIAIGITSWIALQALVNIGSMTGLLPLTGIPLPFISYGGSALISELIGLGLLLNISKEAS